MASSVTTYGKKKRNLLRSLGSYRRQRGLSPLSEDQVQDRFVTEPNPLDGNRPKVTRPSFFRHSDTIDEIDDDSTDALAHAQKAAQNIPSSKCTKVLSINQPPRTDIPLNPLAMNPVWIDDQEAVVERAGERAGEKQPLLADKAPAKLSPTSLSRSASAPFPADLATQCRDFASFDVAPRCVGPSRMPDLESPGNQYSVSDSTPAIGTNRANLAKADEINEKVRAMLAATEALKPKADAPSKMSRIASSRVLTKVTNAWERLNLRPSTPQGKDGNKRHRRGDSSTAEALNRLSVGSADMGFDGGGKANKKKGRHEKQPASISSAAASHDMPMHTQHPESPFDSEQGFEYNLHDRILTEVPIGYSTPRAQSQDGAAVASTDGSGMENDSSEMHVDVAREVKMGQDDATRGPARQLTLKPSQSTRGARLNTDTMSWRGRGGYGKTCELAKKHPSPSKEDLEKLEQALQRHQAPRAPLLARDKNQMIRRRLSAREVDPLALAAPSLGFKASVQRPSDGGINRRARVRRGPPFQAVTGIYEDFDELS